MQRTGRVWIIHSTLRSTSSAKTTSTSWVVSRMKRASTSGAIRYLRVAMIADCVERKRTHVSAAYFLSIEFQETGGLVDGLYRASFGRRPNYAEFKPDAAAVAPVAGG